MKMNQQNQTSNQSLAQILATNQSTQNLYEHWNSNSIDCLGSVTQTILPPPLFDTNCNAPTQSAASNNYNQCYEIQNHPGNYCTLSAIEMPKMPSSSKRLHRTIPKHFTMSSPSALINSGEIMQNHTRNTTNSNLNNNNNNNNNNLNNSSEQNNKKPSCQCPVQHVPMTYMQFSSTQIAQTPPTQQQQQQQQLIQEIQQHHQHQHSLYMASGKKNNVIKSTTFPSAMNVQNVSTSSVATNVSGGKIQTITNASELLSIGSDLLPSSTVDMSSSGASIISSGGSNGTLRRSGHKSLSSSSSNPSSSSSSATNNLNVMPTTPNKKSIATISVAQSPIAQQLPPNSGYYVPQSKMDAKQPQQIHSILKNKNQSQNCHINVINVSDACGMEKQNPILPPKMYKNNNGKYSITSNAVMASGMNTNSGSAGGGGSSSKQIHTITRPNELKASSSQFTLLSINGNNSTNGSVSAATQKYQQQSSTQYQPTQLRTNIQVSYFIYLSSLELI
jgi:hypothetical protein